MIFEETSTFPSSFVSCEVRSKNALAQANTSSALSGNGRASCKRGIFPSSFGFELSNSRFTTGSVGWPMIQSDKKTPLGRVEWCGKTGVCVEISNTTRRCYLFCLQRRGSSSYSDLRCCSSAIDSMRHSAASRPRTGSAFAAQMSCDS